MPLPTPKDNENKDDFMQRCMADPKMGDEYDTNEQRYAVCNVQWEDKARFFSRRTRCRRELNKLDTPFPR